VETRDDAIRLLELSSETVGLINEKLRLLEAAGGQGSVRWRKWWNYRQRVMDQRDEARAALAALASATEPRGE
jgi:hypothetical protein